MPHWGCDTDSVLGQMVSVAIGNGAIGQGHLVRVNWSGSIGQIARLSVVRFLPDTARFLHPIVHLMTFARTHFFW